MSDDSTCCGKSVDGVVGVDEAEMLHIAQDIDAMGLDSLVGDDEIERLDGELAEAERIDAAETWPGEAKRRRYRHSAKWLSEHPGYVEAKERSTAVNRALGRFLGAKKADIVKELKAYAVAEAKRMVAEELAKEDKFRFKSDDFYSPVGGGNGLPALMMEGRSFKPLRDKGVRDEDIDRLVKYLEYRLDRDKVNVALAKAGVRWHGLEMARKICPDFNDLCNEVDDMVRKRRVEEARDQLHSNAIGDTDVVEGKAPAETKAALAILAANDPRYKSSTQPEAQQVVISIDGGLFGDVAKAKEPVDADVVDDVTVDGTVFGSESAETEESESQEK